jgi:hypothetical protein
VEGAAGFVAAARALQVYGAANVLDEVEALFYLFYYPVRSHEV